MSNKIHTCRDYLEYANDKKIERIINTTLNLNPFSEYLKKSNNSSTLVPNAPKIKYEKNMNNVPLLVLENNLL